MPFAIRPKQTVVFIGDSITDAGRRHPSAPLGDGYVRMISELIVARYPAHGLRVVNTGISGNTVRDLYHRWTDDAVALRPDWLSIKIGINDLHRWYNGIAGQSVTPEEYADLYDQVLARTAKETRAQVVLVDPFYISVDRAEGSGRAAMLERLPRYIRTVEKLARKYNARRVKTHEVFQRALKYYPAEAFCPEPVHPYASGHLVIANAWLEAVGW